MRLGLVILEGQQVRLAPVNLAPLTLRERARSGLSADGGG